MFIIDVTMMTMLRMSARVSSRLYPDSCVIRAAGPESRVFIISFLIIPEFILTIIIGRDIGNIDVIINKEDLCKKEKWLFSDFLHSSIHRTISQIFLFTYNSIIHSSPAHSNSGHCKGSRKQLKYSCPHYKRKLRVLSSSEALSFSRSSHRK